MPNYFCFNIDSPKFLSSFPYFSAKGDILEFTSKREININEGDKFVTVRRYFKDYDMEFVSYGYVRNVDIIKNSYDDEYNYYKISVYIEEVLKGNNLLSELVYSLLHIKNYSKPYRHFTRNYTFLDPIDFETITKGRIFISRSVFGRILKSLPKPHFKQFIISLIESGNFNFFKSNDYILLLKQLRKYISTEIIEPGSLIIELDDILKNNFKGILESDAIGFLGEEEEKADYIYYQANLLRELFSIEVKNDFWKAVDREIEQSIDTEVRFNNKFSTIMWPTDIGEI